MYHIYPATCNFKLCCYYCSLKPCYPLLKAPENGDKTIIGIEKHIAIF